MSTFSVGWLLPLIATAALLALVSPLDILQITAASGTVACLTYRLFAWRIVTAMASLPCATRDESEFAESV